MPASSTGRFGERTRCSGSARLRLQRHPLPLRSISPARLQMRCAGAPVSYVVAATSLGRDTPWQERAGNATGSIHMVDLLRTTGSAIRGLALPAFMDNALRQADAIRHSKMLGPIAPNKKLPQHRHARYRRRRCKAADKP